MGTRISVIETEGMHVSHLRSERGRMPFIREMSKVARNWDTRAWTDVQVQLNSVLDEF